MWHQDCDTCKSTLNSYCSPLGNKTHSLMASVPTPLQPLPPPSVARHLSGQPFSSWEHDFIIKMNCLIVRTKLPLLAGACRRGLAGHWGLMPRPGFRGQFTHCLKSISCNGSEAPSLQSRALTQPHQAGTTVPNNVAHKLISLLYWLPIAIIRTECRCLYSFN